MSHSSNQFSQMLEKARRGDNQALTRLIAEYEKELQTVARVQLGAPLRPYLDSIDVVQSVHRSLMIGLRQDRYEVRSPDDLIALALTIVKRKIARHWRKLKRQQRDSGAWTTSTSGEYAVDRLLAAAPQETPVAIAARKERLQHVLDRLDDRERELIELRVMGYSTKEASQLMGHDPDVTRVRLSRLRKRLRALGCDTDLL